MNDISKDSRKVLKVLIKQYKKRLKQGQDKDSATYFQSSAEIHDSWFPDWSQSSVEYACRELSRQGYLRRSSYNNISTIIYLTDKSLTAYENERSNSFKSALKYIWDIVKTVLKL